jgi:hypothetical protein
MFGIVVSRYDDTEGQLSLVFGEVVLFEQSIVDLLIEFLVLLRCDDVFMGEFEIGK